jgi:hypothetical protein
MVLYRLHLLFFMLLYPVAFPGLERICRRLFEYIPIVSIHLEELENHKHISLPQNLNRFFQNESGMLYLLSHCVQYFMGVGFNSPHEYYVLSPQSF